MSYNIEENVELFSKQEKEYARLISGFGDIIFATKFQDMKEHWDVKLVNKGKTILTDVKAMKKIHRWDESPSDDKHYIELKNGSGYDGWLYAGKADCYAFETKDSYVVVDKKPLQKFIDEKNDGEVLTEPKLYKLYQRKDKKDVMMLVETSELIKIARRIVKKEPLRN